MKLKSVRLKHISHFTDLQLELDEQPLTLIIGDQASGKTSILKNIYQALTWFPARLKDLRTAGVFIQDQDIMHNRLQAKVDIQVSLPAEIGNLAESSNVQATSSSLCSWQLYKTLNAQGTGISKVETVQLEQMVMLYQQAIRQDPMLGLPLIAYYPSERFTNETNLLSKNIPTIFQAASAYDLVSVPFTTFIRFFEWLREVSDVENARTTQLFHELLKQYHASTIEFQHGISQLQTQLYAPCLSALKHSLQTVIPELTEIYLEYQPKLQLMVVYAGKTLMFQQLSSTLKTWIALVGDIVRRLCLLNPLSLYPCLEGEGILLIDNIDAHLDLQSSQYILEGLKEAFPRLQIIATASQSELLETNPLYALRLDNRQLYKKPESTTWTGFTTLYQDLEGQETLSDSANTNEAACSALPQIVELIKQLSATEYEELLRLIKNGSHSLPISDADFK
ncbi:ATP-binding protein [Acinetobacter radioresistens]|uniref:Rad50/SbcC-type AAA domain-containing protein n=1 Tax=Acinetobacter radioresistens SK82 TaxID=596318 RepID=A0ABM9YN17_ACIRA|nr:MULTISPECIES: AAA family ATPase [Acinetobacter]EET82442.1 hypothetical protein ACIRA0001_2592 [Acinetobacter radioresistens SK82]EEY86122.1 hypothetical protein HMPREF0018_01956 [Acinetobacter radioresistens SH164]ENV86055.1 hypothetical protein F940_01354 [Acinetobacter radioresistens NIPH 2130]EXB86632.1 AAA ATPase domain protein [Acinetobacter sp. 272263]MBA5696762.1 ATP-binding protein [Acinetobacter radioresistens]